MKMKSLPVVVAAALMCGSWIRAEAAPPKPESLEAYQSRIAWFAEAQYGMFIHFGLYSILGGEWKGEKVGWHSEWIPATKSIPRETHKGQTFSSRGWHSPRFGDRTGDVRANG